MPKKSFEELLRQAHVASNHPLSHWWRLHGGHHRQTAGASALTRRAIQNSDGSLFAQKV